MTIVRIYNEDDQAYLIGTDEVYSHHDLSGIGYIIGDEIEMPPAIPKMDEDPFLGFPRCS